MKFIVIVVLFCIVCCFVLFVVVVLDGGGGGECFILDFVVVFFTLKFCFFLFLRCWVMVVSHDVPYNYYHYVFLSECFITFF